MKETFSSILSTFIHAVSYTEYTHYRPMRCTQLTQLVTTLNQEQSKYKHSLTFRVRRYAVIAMKPMHRLESAQQCTTRGHPLPFRQLTSGLVELCGNAARDIQTDTQRTAVTTIHFASATPHAKYNYDLLTTASHTYLLHGTCTPSLNFARHFMVALWNRADHYIFMLWFVLLLSSSHRQATQRLPAPPIHA